MYSTHPSRVARIEDSHLITFVATDIRRYCNIYQTINPQFTSELSTWMSFVITQFITGELVMTEKQRDVLKNMSYVIRSVLS